MNKIIRGYKHQSSKFSTAAIVMLKVTSLCHIFFSIKMSHTFQPKPFPDLRPLWPDNCTRKSNRNEQNGSHPIANVQRITTHQAKVADSRGAINQKHSKTNRLRCIEQKTLQPVQKYGSTRQRGSCRVDPYRHDGCQLDPFGVSQTLLLCPLKISLSLKIHKKVAPSPALVFDSTAHNRWSRAQLHVHPPTRRLARLSRSLRRLVLLQGVAMTS